MYELYPVILQEGKALFSKVSDLQPILHDFKQKLGTVDQPSALQQAHDLAIDTTVVHTGEELLQEKLSSYQMFHDVSLEKHWNPGYH